MSQGILRDAAASGGRNRAGVAGLAVLALVAAWGPLPAAAQAEPAGEIAQAAGQAFDIGPGALGSVLGQFAGAAGVVLSFDAQLTEGLSSDGLNGRYTVEQGFSRLLAPHRLQAVRGADGIYLLQALPPPVEAVTLPAVPVTAPTETASSPVGGYVARRSATGTKTDTPVRETPQAISVVTREQMDAQGVESLEQAFAYSAGINPLAGSGNKSTGTAFTMRGFNVTGSAPLYLNGSKFPINSLSGPEEPYLYERVELLKGPASVLYGQAAPGGIINLVSKRPTETPLRELELQVGSWNRRQIGGDFSGPIDASGKLGFRVTGLLRNGETMVEEIGNDRGVIATSVSWKPSEDTSLLLLGSYVSNDTAYDYGKPFDGTNLPNPNGKIARDLFVGEPGFDKFDTTGFTIGYLLEHRLNPNWQLRQNLLRFDRQTDSRTVSIANRTDTVTQRTATRSVYTRDDADFGFSLDNQVQGKLAHGLFEHTLLVGLDYSDRTFDRTQGSGTVAALDVFNPVYGSPVTLSPLTTGSVGDNEQMGIYVQDHVKLAGRWIALLGARWDDTEAVSRNRATSGAITNSESKQDAMTYRAGLLYLFDNGLSPYLSWAESFQPQSGFTFDGEAFEPTTGEQYEAGLKFEPRGLNASFTAAVYELTRQKVLTPDPDPTHPNSSIQAGEVRSRGVELEGRATLARQLDLVASYTYTDAEITRSNGVDLGRVPSSTPRHTALLWADYRWAGGPLDGLSAGAGVRNVGKSYSLDNSFTVPSYTVYDAAVRYLFGPWRFSLSVKNLLDKEYVGACTFSCFYGDERNLTASVRYTW